MKPIDLGYSYEELQVTGPSPEKEKKHYPSFRIEGVKELNLPHEGEMTVRFTKVASSESERDGKRRYECTIEVNEIVDVEGGEEAPTKNYSKDAEDALDTLMKAHLKDKSESY